MAEGFPQHGLHEGMLIGRRGLLVCCKIGWRQLDFSWAYPFIERDSKESEHIQIIMWDRR